MATFGLAILVYIFSLIFKYSFGVGFFIWLLLAIIASIAEEQEKSGLIEKQEKEDEMRATWPCLNRLSLPNFIKILISLEVQRFRT